MTEKLKKPKKGQTGLKIHCRKCLLYGGKCKHYEDHTYRIVVYIPGSKNPKIKTLETRDYDEAVLQAAEFRKEVKSNAYALPQPQVAPSVNDYSLADAIVKYNQYLEGNHELEQHKKDVSKDHRQEAMRYCLYFAETVKQRADISRLRITDVTKYDVSNFYRWMHEKGFKPRTFNKGMKHLKAMFSYLIDVEEIVIRNPFGAYESLPVGTTEKITLTRVEFEKILHAVETADPMQVINRFGRIENRYRPYLIPGFRLALLSGLRREEFVLLRWDELITAQGIQFFKVKNLKVSRQRKDSETYKYVPVNADLAALLSELKREQTSDTDFVLYPQRTETTKVIIENLSRGFTHYRKAAGIEKQATLKSIRKTYITWVKAAMQKQTGLLTSHTTEDIIDRHYADPTVLSAIEKGMLQIKIFGEE